MQTENFARHPHARLLTCAARLYEDRPVTAKWISKHFKVGIAAARRDVRWLRMYLPLRVVDHDDNRGRGRDVHLLGVTARTR